MASANDKRRRLRDALHATDIVAAPGAGDPITARLLELAGFPAVHVSGSVAHRMSGYSDAGILTMHEMLERIIAMDAVSDIPLISDADTGFGGAVNVVRTVKEYERAGASAIHIEDQLTPKRPIHMGAAGAFISTTEMVDKIRAAVDSRTDSDFLVISRCDIPDQQEKLERLQACLEAGADIGWLSSHDADDTRLYTQAFGGKPSLGVLPRGLTLHEYQDAGASCAVLPGILQIAALTAQRALLEELKAKGTVVEYLSTLPHAEEMTQFYNRQGADELARIETEYGGTGK
jgi:2-methylisocitrate lyase-like PEP mutase family enzyme